MSLPKNPLKDFSTYTIRHVLAVFKYNEDAEQVNLSKSSGKTGDSILSGIILVNEFNDDRFFIPSIKWKWSKYGPSGKSTTSLDGALDIQDRAGGNFIDWFRLNVCKHLTISTQHMTFVLKTYFTGIDAAGGNKLKVYTGNQLIFHVHQLSDEMNVDGDGTLVRLLFTGAYNTTGQLPTVCKPYQITLTHKDGNLNNVDPEVFSSTAGTIQSRSAEDSFKFPGRINRLNKGKPIKTLKEAFDALEFDLNQQPYTHKTQVQKWLGKIISNYTPKLDPPKQQRGAELPIKFHIDLDPEYHNYSIDNRNLPFEQTEENSMVSGVVAIPFRPGATITEMIETIMKYSIQVGKDAGDKLTPTAFKTNICYARKKSDNKVHIYITIKKIYIPFNTAAYGDTGPGEGAIDPAPLEFTFKSGIREDVDITYFKTSICADNGVIPLEYGNRSAIFGNREPVTGERITNTAPTVNYFKSAYSGLRLPIITSLNSGLEDANAAANIDVSYLVTNEQPSNHEVEIVGNPQLMFDLHRLPSQTFKLNNPGNAQYYKMPESIPMYIKIKIYIEPDAKIGLKPAMNVPITYYYTNYYEVSSIVNDMTNGVFIQHLILKKTDDIV